MLISTHALQKQVNTAAGPLQILRDINLTVDAGERVAIIGVSGSGKSTLLALLAGLDLPSSGSIIVNGHELTTLNEDGRARLRGREMGFVFQSFQLLPALTACENVMLPLELAGASNPRPQALELLQRVGLSERIHHYPRQLSGGEQQRVAIARAFANRPAILLADEPTGNLDSATGEIITDLIFALNSEAKTTLLLVTHDQEMATRCERSITLQAGGIIHDTKA
ncbi:MAG: ATP-binding cassette domain-containing protein [Gammaproteobacteria bacterium]|nr:ATP-binding cassette domain-containing protein [Gammaproteobacteria bacterium]